MEIKAMDMASKVMEAMATMTILDMGIMDMGQDMTTVSTVIHKYLPHFNVFFFSFVHFKVFSPLRLYCYLQME